VKRLVWRANATFSRNRIRDFVEYVDDWDTGEQRAIRHGDTELSFSPSVIAGSELSYRVWEKSGRGHADLTWVTKYVGDQYLDNTGSRDRMLDAYVVNDMRANVSLRAKGLRSIDLNLTVRNIFSALYESNGWVYSYYENDRRMEMIGLYPQAPLNVLGGVSVGF